MNEFTTQREMVFERITHAIKQMISEHEFERILKGKMDFNWFFDSIHRYIVMNLSIENLCQIQPKPLDYRHPETWKDALKEKRKNKWFMKRWIRKHPITYKNVEFELRKITIFPDLDIPHDDIFRNRFSYVVSEKKEVVCRD